MELSAEDIETLRAGMALWATAEGRQPALAILNRLSPPEPEQPDEATKIWREMKARGCDGAPTVAAKLRRGDYDRDDDSLAEISYLRQVLSELIASKDAEIERQASYLAARDSQIGILKRAAHTDAEMLSAAEAELAALRAEIERVKATLAGQEAISDQVHEALWEADKAAERNPAEQSSIRGAGYDPNCEVCKGSKFTCDEHFKKDAQPAESWSVIDTAPVVEVTGADRDAVAKGLYWLSVENKNSATSCFAHHRTEAEARGRREALESMRVWADKCDIWIRRVDLIASVQSLLTEGK